MTLAEPGQVASPTSERPRRGVGWWAEQILPRLVGLLFLWAGIEKAIDPTRIQRVLAFDGIPQSLLPSAALVLWAGEIAIGLALMFNVAWRRTIPIAIFVLLAFSVQIAYLIVAQNAPDCACVDLLRKYQTAHQALVTGLVRNAVMAGCLEWVRLRWIRRERTGAPAQTPGTGAD
jgi:hypothetical protein